MLVKALLPHSQAWAHVIGGFLLLQCVIYAHGQGLSSLDISPTRTFPSDGQALLLKNAVACVFINPIAELLCMRTAVSALHAFSRAVTDRGGRLQSWRMGSDPCGAPNCMHNAQPSSSMQAVTAPAPSPVAANGSPATSQPALCAWSGISCSSWRVVSIILPCRTADASCTGLQGQLPGDDLATMDALTILDLQARLTPLQHADQAQSLTPVCVHMIVFLSNTCRTISWAGRCQHRWPR